LAQELEKRNKRFLGGWNSRDLSSVGAFLLGVGVLGRDGNVLANVITEGEYVQSRRGDDDLWREKDI
jgi:hypothetical protein